jgi:hypothetical protein
LSSAKECVTTHLPKQLALKMDGAQVVCRYNAVKIKSLSYDTSALQFEILTSRKVLWYVSKYLT